MENASSSFIASSGGAAGFDSIIITRPIVSSSSSRKTISQNEFGCWTTTVECSVTESVFYLEARSNKPGFIVDVFYCDKQVEEYRV